MNFIKSIDQITKISDLPTIYSNYIKSNKNKIIKTVQLKYNFINSKNKKIFI